MVVLGSRRRARGAPGGRAPQSSGIDVRLVMGNDPPGSFTRVLHPRLGRHGEPPPEVIPIGRSVIVPANGSLPNIILSPRSVFRIRRVLERERFDLLHLHEPMTPTPVRRDARAGPAARSSRPSTPSGELSWLKLGEAGLGLPARPARPPDRRLGARPRVGRTLLPRRLRADPERRARSRTRPTPARARTASSSSAATSRARACRCCFAPGPRSSGAPARGCGVVGADPLAVRLLFARLRVPDEGDRRARLPLPGRPDRGAARARRRSSRRRSAARASGWCSRARSPARRRSSPPTSPGYRGVMEPRGGPARAARRPGGARGGARRRCSRTSRGAGRARSRGPRARAGALLVGRDRAAARRDLRGLVAGSRERVSRHEDVLRTTVGPASR